MVFICNSEGVGCRPKQGEELQVGVGGGDPEPDPQSEKPPKRSGSRSSNISKASSSTTGLGHTSVSRTSVTPSSQDICSPCGPLPKVEEDLIESTPVTVLSPAGQQPGKRQVKKRQRRKRDVPAKRGPGENSGGSEPPPEELPGNRGDLRRDRDSSTSSDEEESWREAHSWSRERLRRGRRRSRSSKGREQAWESEQDIELLSVGSDDGPKMNKETLASPSTGQGEAGRSGLKNRRKPSTNKEERQPSPAPSSQKGRSGSSGEILTSGLKPGSSSPQEQDRIARVYEECGSGEDVLSAPPATPALSSPSDPPALRSANHSSAGQQHQRSDDELEVCRICHCEGDEECPLITPCRCTGSLRFVHQGCLHQWIKSSDTRCCELCKYDFIMETQLKPLRKIPSPQLKPCYKKGEEIGADWEKLQMSTGERRKIICSVTFHIIAVTCVVWSLYVLIDRTAEEIKQGKETGVLEWPFWTKLIVVAIGFTGGVIFMYIQCKVYFQLWRRLKAFNRIIFVQNCPDTMKKGEDKTVLLTQTNGRHDTVEVPVSQMETNSHKPTGGAVVPEVAPV